MVGTDAGMCHACTHTQQASSQFIYQIHLQVIGYPGPMDNPCSSATRWEWVPNHMVAKLAPSPQSHIQWITCEQE